MLYDHRGRPIRTSDLRKEVATSSVTSVRTVWYESIASGLTPTSLASLLRAVDQNDTLAFLTLAEEMEERDLHYQSVLGTRKRAVTGLDAMVEAASDDAKDVEIADAVREEVVATSQFNELLPMAMDAIGKSYSCTEIMWSRGARWIPEKYVWRDPRFFCFDMNTGNEIRMRDEKDASEGVPLAAYKFVVHRPVIKMGLTIRGGLARMACVAYMLKGYSVKDWWAFMEVFGMPWRLGRYETGATESQKDDLLAAVRELGIDAACIMPKDMDVEIIEASRTASGGDKLFLNATEWVDKQVSKGVLGQVATTEGTPGRLGNEEAQENVREDIRRDDSKQLAATIMRDLIKPYIHLNWGEQKRYPSLRLIIDDPEDLKLLSESLPPFIDRGLRVQASIILDKFGIAEAEDGAEVLQPKSGGPSPAGGTNPGPEEPPEEDNDGEDEEAMERERRMTVVGLLKRMRHGEQLSTSEQQVLIAGLAAEQPRDEVERLAAAELDNWRLSMDPALQPILDLAEHSSSYKEFLDGLEDVLAQMDTTKFAERIATMTFIARGLGDATDEV